MKLRLVPHDPFVDTTGVVAHGLVDEAAPVVLGIVVGEVEVLGHGSAGIVQVRRGPGRSELEQASQAYAAVQLTGDGPRRDRSPEPAPIVRSVRLNIGPRQYDALPARTDVGHHRGISKPL